MSVSAIIIIDIKQDVLLVPNSAIKTQNSTNYVEIFENATSSNGLYASVANSARITSKTPPEQLPIEVGLSNDSMTEVTSGLKEGDQVVSQTIAADTAQTQSQSSSSVRIPGIGGFGR